jgi:ribosomal protein S18 acetylase RimI-like enzyme
MTILTPMRPENFLSFAETANTGYAQENVAVGRWTSDEAPARAQAEFLQLLPQGLATPEHYIYEIQEESTGEMAGFLWFAVVGKGDASFAYVYNICVAQPFRRRGHARAAFLWLEQFARAQGIAGVRLNVFAHNSVAQVLYHSLGFKSMSVMMHKALSENGG